MEDERKLKELIGQFQEYQGYNAVTAVMMFKNNQIIMSQIKDMLLTCEFENGFESIFKTTNFVKFLRIMNAKDVVRTLLFHKNCSETDFNNFSYNSKIYDFIDNNDIIPLLKKGFTYNGLLKYRTEPIVINFFGVIGYDYRLEQAVLPIHFNPGNPKKAKMFFHKCPVCLNRVSKAERSIHRMADCQCTFHIDCALKSINFQIDTLYDKNPLERKIPTCPGCQKEVVPSIYQAFLEIPKMPYFELLDLFQGEIPKVITSNKDVFKKISSKSVNEINKKIISIKFQNHPRYTPCSGNGCGGFAIINQNEEKFTECQICHKSQLFRGKNIKINPTEQKELKQLLSKTTTIRPCTTCGKVVEKRDGCDSMMCPFCNKHFNWEKASYDKDTENATF